jgi:hypothetical protein
MAAVERFASRWSAGLRKRRLHFVQQSGKVDVDGGLAMLDDRKQEMVAAYCVTTQRRYDFTQATSVRDGG